MMHMLDGRAMNLSSEPDEERLCFMPSYHFLRELREICG